MLIPLLLSGGGVGGLTLAFALSKSPNICVDIYEAASEFAEIGAGIGVWWRSRQVLTSLGLEEHITRLVSFPPGQDKGNQEGMRQVYETINVLAAPSAQHRKADQPNGHAMGTTYTRGLILFLV